MKSILEVNNVSTTFSIHRGLFRHRQDVQALVHVSFALMPGETLGIVGESGSGKSTLARTILRLVPARLGNIYFEDIDILHVPLSQFRPYRKHIQMVFQDPYSSLNPRMIIRDIVTEGARNFGIFSDSETLMTQTEKMLGHVGLSPDVMPRFPHAFSGGQRQRIGIARALMVQPKILIADEPVSALDVSIQAQILTLLQNIQQSLGLTLIFISHNLAVVRHISHRIMVMYLGKVMEMAETQSLFARKRHPYTQALMGSVLSHHPTHLQKRKFLSIAGEIPSPTAPPSGCVFRTRCPKAQALCAQVEPPLEEDPKGHFTACHFKD